jgi:hypothetical protein
MVRAAFPRRMSTRSSVPRCGIAVQMNLMPVGRSADWQCEWAEPDVDKEAAQVSHGIGKPLCRRARSDRRHNIDAIEAMVARAQNVLDGRPRICGVTSSGGEMAQGYSCWREAFTNALSHGDRGSPVLQRRRSANPPMTALRRPRLAFRRTVHRCPRFSAVILLDDGFTVPSGFHLRTR